MRRSKCRHTALGLAAADALVFGPVSRHYYVVTGVGVGALLAPVSRGRGIKRLAAGI